MSNWKCTICGYIKVGEAPPEICPHCATPAKQFVQTDEEPKPKPKVG